MGALLPTKIEVVGQELAVVWSDGEESFLPLEPLRRACPCAVCSGEPDVLGNIWKPKSAIGPGGFAIRSLQTVGGYALQPTWADGHSTGLYTFRFLRELAAGKPPASAV